jgi:hypothetical protein
VHGKYVRIAYRVSSLDMGPCARRRRLGSILGCGAGTSTIRVRVRVRVSGSRGRHARQYFGRHGIYVRIGYRLSSLDMGPRARRRRLGSILGRGAGTSTIRVRVRVRVSGSRGRHARQYFGKHGIYMRC